MSYGIRQKDLFNKWDGYAINATSKKAKATLNAIYATEADVNIAFASLPKRMREIHYIAQLKGSPVGFQGMPEVFRGLLF